MNKRALVVIDLQNEYLPSGKLPLEGVNDAISNAATVIAYFRERGEPVINVRHEFGDDAPFFVPGSDGVDIVPEVAPQDGEKVIIKHYPNAFRETDLKQFLDGEGVEEIVFVGAMSHMCIAASVRAATDFGYDTVTVHDACATMDLEFNGVSVPAKEVHAANMAALDFAYGNLVSTKELVRG